MTITNDIRYVGVNDHDLDLFEGHYVVPNGMACNSYVILDEKIAVLDSVDRQFGQAWLNNIREVLGGRTPDYLVVQYMEPDHSSNIGAFLSAYPNAKVVASAKTFQMTKNFFGQGCEDRRVVADEKDTLSLGKHTLTFPDTTANKNDLTALFKIGYGLYVVTSHDGTKDNGLIVNTVSQLTNNPNRIAVNISKETYSHEVIKKSCILNVNCLDVSTPFSVFRNFGFQSGRTADKFAGIDELRSDNGLRFLPRHINAFISLKVERYVDLDTHGMFICTVTEARVISQKETMTYSYYQQNVKPKPKTEGKKGYVCKVCGWIYEGESLPEDIVCPLCKHGYADFEPIQ